MPVAALPQYDNQKCLLDIATCPLESRLPQLRTTALEEICHLYVGNSIQLERVLID